MAASPRRRRRATRRTGIGRRSGRKSVGKLIGHAPNLPRSRAGIRTTITSAPQQKLQVTAVHEILTVCTGNICRSPLAAQLLTARLRDLGVVATSAGVRARDGAPMTAEAAALAARRGVDPGASAAHRARYLTAAHLAAPVLVLAMARDHRREVVELAPARLRTTFTIREFARLAGDVSDDEIRAASDAAGPDPTARLAAALAVVAGRRGLVVPASSPDDDDVVDPYGRSQTTYDRSLAELEPGVSAVERVFRVSLSRNTPVAD